jgi:tetraacyldisaccharide-1-P 4'-kinase
MTAKDAVRAREAARKPVVPVPVEEPKPRRTKPVEIEPVEIEPIDETDTPEEHE